jgi:antitoxin ParD1/3/4
MSMHRKTITLTEQQDHWVKGQIKGGNFGNDSEYIRDLIRRDQQSQERIATLRQALKDGEASGTAKPLNMGSVKKAARARSKLAG